MLTFLAEQLEELVGRCENQVEVEDRDDLALDLEDLFCSVGVVAALYEVFEVWRVDFFVLGSDEQRGDADQLQLSSGHHDLLKVAVDEVHRQEEGLMVHLELGVDIHQPVDQDGPHLLVDVLLQTLEVVALAQILDLGQRQDYLGPHAKVEYFCLEILYALLHSFVRQLVLDQRLKLRHIFLQFGFCTIYIGRKASLSVFFLYFFGGLLFLR